MVPRPGSGVVAGRPGNLGLRRAVQLAALECASPSGSPESFRGRGRAVPFRGGCAKGKGVRPFVSGPMWCLEQLDILWYCDADPRMEIFTKVLTECLLEVPEIPFENCNVNYFMSVNKLSNVYDMVSFWKELPKD